LAASFTPADPGFEARVRASFARQGAMAHLGAELVRIEPGRVDIAMAFRPELAQQHGFFHAGLVSTIMDTAGGYAGFTLFPPEAAVLTVEFKVNLIAAADGESVLAEGRVIRSGRTLTVCQMDAFVEKAGRRVHCATGVQTLMSVVGRTGVKD
jgi:uncharacterized protein (TIGR00369 family)